MVTKKRPTTQFAVSKKFRDECERLAVERCKATETNWTWNDILRDAIELGLRTVARNPGRIPRSKIK